jgi:hypothetical protein
MKLLVESSEAMPRVMQVDQIFKYVTLDGQDEEHLLLNTP